MISHSTSAEVNTKSCGLLSKGFAITALTSIAGTAVAASEDVLPLNSQPNRDLPQKFAVDCIWSETTSVRKSANGAKSKSRAVSSSNLPEKISPEHGIGWVEFAGLNGERHFAMPSTGGPLAGQFLTVFSDGRATRNQTLLLNDEIRISTEIGHCEVTE